uniref:Large ribosomal subunit protein bL33m n=1 Tax=Capra hircus TaxID=9925 RepID=A0A8C2NUN7_CAPHI
MFAALLGEVPCVGGKGAVCWPSIHLSGRQLSFLLFVFGSSTFFAKYSATFWNAVAKSKSKTILVKMVSQAGTGFSFNTKRSRLWEKLTLLHYDPVVKKKVLFVEQKKIRSL